MDDGRASPRVVNVRDEGMEGICGDARADMWKGLVGMWMAMEGDAPESLQSQGRGANEQGVVRMGVRVSYLAWQVSNEDIETGERTVQR